jgi:hypothetical protein
MQTINQIKLQVRIEAGKVLHEPESISLEVWSDAYIIQEHVSVLNEIRRELEDQIDEDLEDVCV